MKPNDLVVFLHYMNSFDHRFGYSLKEIEPTDLEDAKQKASKMESHLSNFIKVDLLGNLPDGHTKG
jgi:hypothetical protein